VVRENTEDLYAGIEFEKGTKALEEVRKSIEKNSNYKTKLNVSFALIYLTQEVSNLLAQWLVFFVERKKALFIDIIKLRASMGLMTTHPCEKFYLGISNGLKMVDSFPVL